MTLMGPNYSTVQEQLRIMKSGTEQEKSKITPDSIRDIRAYIEQERKASGRNYSLEGEFKEWEDLAKNYESEKGQITTATANATANTAAGLSQTDGVVKGEQLIDVSSDKIRESLEVINPESLEKAINISEQAINLIKSEEAKATLRGVHGAIIFDILRNAGHNLIMQNGQITIMPKSGTDTVNLQEKLQTLVNTKRISLDTIKLGMLYSSPSFKSYAENKKRKDANGKDIIDPSVSSQDFIDYLHDLEKAGNKGIDIETILKSQSLLRGVNMQQAIKGFQDMGQVGEWIQKNPQLAQTATNLGNQAMSSPGLVQAVAPSSNIPSGNPSNYLSSQLVGNGGQANSLGKGAGEIIGGSFKGFGALVGDLLKAGEGSGIATLGIGASILYGIWKLFHLGPSGAFSFGRGLMGILGIGALNNGQNIADIFKGTNSATPANDPAPVTTPTVAPVPMQSNNTQSNTPPETQAQRVISDKIRKSPELAQILDPQRLAGKKRNGNIEAYLSFINTDLKDKKLEIFTSGKTDASVFSQKSMLDPSIILPPNLDPVVFKSVMRMYLTGTYMSEAKMNEPANVAIIKEKLSKVPDHAVGLHDAIVAIQK